MCFLAMRFIWYLSSFPALDSTSTAKTTIQRTSKGVVGFHSVDSNGGSATIENTTSGQRQKVGDWSDYPSFVFPKHDQAVCCFYAK